MAPKDANADRSDGKRDEPLFLLLLARGYSVRAAARRANIPRNTAQRKASKPAFRKKVDALRDELVRRALGRMVGAQGKAAGTLKELLSAESEKTRLGAAKAILDTTLKLRDQVGVVERLNALQKELDEVRRANPAAQGARPDGKATPTGGAAEKQPDHGGDPAGTRGDHGAGGHAPGPVAEGTAEPGFFENPTLLQPPKREEFDRGRAGHQGGLA
jgi:hypothetical protein